MEEISNTLFDLFIGDDSSLDGSMGQLPNHFNEIGVGNFNSQLIETTLNEICPSFIFRLFYMLKQKILKEQVVHILIVALVVICLTKAFIQAANREKAPVIFMRGVLEVIFQRHTMLNNHSFSEKLKKYDSNKNLSKYLNEEASPTLMEKIKSFMIPIREQRVNKVYQKVLDQCQQSEKEVSLLKCSPLKKYNGIDKRSRKEFLQTDSPKFKPS